MPSSSCIGLGSPVLNRQVLNSKFGPNLLKPRSHNRILEIAEVDPFQYQVFLAVCLFWFLFLGPHAVAAYGGSQAKGEIRATVIATWNQSLICKLHQGSLQRWIPDPLSEARNRT